MDRQGAAEHRVRLLDGLVGRVVEIGSGDGANLALYPAEVTSVVAVEPEPYLRAQTQRRAAEVASRLEVEVVDAAAEQLPVADGSVDGVVASLVLCSVGDQRAALLEAFRVLRPGGQLRFYEHVAAPAGTRLAKVQRFSDATLWPLMAGGCHVGRDTATAIEAAGFVIDEIERFDFPPGGTAPASPHILGRATRPGSSGPGSDEGSSR
jgi:ubiquinone/menaquinone biosynthesis C-methylase UbiE